ncbi:hypothetical protein [Methylocella tundrae]|uniref:Uncharacterized protein n=1 Tax=Methylocella tundrae TaxID=227605 RepID=A0A4V6IND3_METTU|nr:hypothetical protein [Methylocella tundrae]WPP02740.1 hypothetical protein SIN04_00085 [Methylocella tundrae]VFU17493.1 conserved protein of unknown function [Methylocella tundrae]
MTIQNQPYALQPIGNTASPFDSLDAFDYDAARREGWTISDCGVYGDGSRRVELQKTDDPIQGAPLFTEDRAAWAHVVQQARRGSSLHYLALQLIDRREKLAVEAHCGTW